MRSEMVFVVEGQGQGQVKDMAVLGPLAFMGNDERRDPRKVRRVLRNTLATRLFRSTNNCIINIHTAQHGRPDSGNQ
jgi:hypothetical protein